MEARQVAGEGRIDIRAERPCFWIVAFLKTEAGWRRERCVHYSYSLVGAIKYADKLFSRWEITKEEERPLVWRDEGGININLSAIQPLLADLFDSVALFLQGDITKERLEEDFRIVWSLLPFLID